MKKSMKIAIVAIIVLLLIISTIIILNSNNSAQKENNSTNEYSELINDIDNTEEFEAKTKGVIQEVTSISDYELANICISKFYNYYAMMYDEIINENSLYNNDYYETKVFNMLTDQYKNKYQITKSNVKDKLGFTEYVRVEIYNLFYITDYENYKVYYVEGLLRNEKTYEIKEFKNTLYIYNKNQVFSLSLENDIDGKVMVGKDANLVLNTTLEKNEDNTFSYPTTSYEEFAKRINDNIRHLILNNPEIAYELLTEEAKDSYKNLDGFKAFINDNRRDLFLLTFEKIEKTYTNEVFTIKIYDSNSKFIINLYFDSFSSFKYEIVKL